MASNKPVGMTWESYVDAMFRQAREAGEFDRLPGAGKPIKGLDEPYNENWWLKQYMVREELSISPDSLQLKAELVHELDELWALAGEDQVRRKLMQLNRKIVNMNSKPVDGPALNLSMIDVESVIKSWKEKNGKL